MVDRDRYMEKLHEQDGIFLEPRSYRLKEIETIGFNAPLFSPLREYQYHKEAGNSYVNGNYLSCIFSCVGVVEQTLRHEYIEIAHDKEKAIKEVNNLTFGRLIGQIDRLNNICGKFKRIESFIEDAKNINKIRNEIAVHPKYLDIFYHTDDDQRLRDKRIAEDIKGRLRLIISVDPSIKSEKKEEKFKELLSTIKIGPQTKKFTLGTILDNNFSVGDTYIDPETTLETIGEYMIEISAKLSYRLMKKIVEGIYAENES